MKPISHIKLVGLNDQARLFDVYPKETKFKDVVCLYAFLSPVQGGFKVLYIGQTTELGTRLANHHKWDEASRRGFEYVAVCTDVSLLGLDIEEESLIRRYSPECNQQLCS